MKAKRIMALAAISSVILSMFLGGCGNDSEEKENVKQEENTEQNTEKEKEKESDDKVTEVTFWGLSQQENYEPIAEAFNEEHKNIRVKISNYDTDGIKDACKVAASSKTLPNMWFLIGAEVLEVFM